MFENDLSMKQENAISLMMLGKNDTEISKELGVSRESVWRWRNENPAFIEAARRRREKLVERHMEELNELLTEAIKVIKENLLNGDPKTKLRIALQLMKMSGMQGYSKIKKEEEMSEKEMMISALEKALPEVYKEKGIKYP